MSKSLWNKFTKFITKPWIWLALCPVFYLLIEKLDTMDLETVLSMFAGFAVLFCFLIFQFKKKNTFFEVSTSILNTSKMSSLLTGQILNLLYLNVELLPLHTARNLNWPIRIQQVGKTSLSWRQSKLTGYRVAFKYSRKGIYNSQIISDYNKVQHSVSSSFYLVRTKFWTKCAAPRPINRILN